MSNRLQLAVINAIGIEASVGLILVILWTLWRMK
jgi:hypothetical protein